jgi:aryl-alcohol dehydrogenase-like predicted oxidoreductase
MILGLGGLGYGISTDEAIRLIARYWELGGRELDTAHTYAHWVPGKLGASDALAGEAVRVLGLPLEEVKITAKGGHPSNGDAYPRPDHYLDPDLVRQDLEECLERMQLDHVDSYLLHRDDSRVPVDELADLLRSLRESGKTAHVGVSNWPLSRVEQLRERLDGTIHWQNQGSLAVPNWQEEPDDPTMRRFRHADFEWAAGHDMVCTCYSATANGYFASGEVKSFDNEVSRERLRKVRELAESRGVSATGIALAWLYAQAGDVRPIIGTTRIGHLEEAMAASEIVLTAEERNALGID